jgi:2-dehydro-3-deoxygalactonokinase
MADWSNGIIAVDWGTTNRRAYLIGADGKLADEMEDELGVTSVPAGGFEEAVAAISRRLGDKPMLLAGMIGSNRGWREAPYVRCPAGEGELARQLLWIDDRTAIVPGLAMDSPARADVMRGEEVQVFGLRHLKGGSGGEAICHPGTHTKWVRLENGRVTDFRTVMTGELFSLLCQHSILAPLLQGEPAAGEAFVAGVDAAVAEGDLSAQLFSVRAKVLLERMAERDASSYLSGLLIGCDIRAGLPLAEGRDIVVLGRPSLTRLYAAGLAHCGRQAREVDGAAAFLAGIQAIKEALQ